jgi:hypothetical protein
MMGTETAEVDLAQRTHRSARFLLARGIGTAQLEGLCLKIQHRAKCGRLFGSGEDLVEGDEERCNEGYTAS